MNGTVNELFRCNVAALVSDCEDAEQYERLHPNGMDLAVLCDKIKSLKGVNIDALYIQFGEPMRKNNIVFLSVWQSRSTSADFMPRSTPAFRSALSAKAFGWVRLYSSSVTSTLNDAKYLSPCCDTTTPFTFPMKRNRSVIFTQPRLGTFRYWRFCFPLCWTLLKALELRFVSDNDTWSSPM